MVAHKPAYIFIVVLAMFVFLVTLFMNYAATDRSLIPGLYENTTGEISDKYSTEVTPAGITFSIWGAIYLYQFIWLVYGLTTLCRKSANGYLYYSPPYLPLSIYVIYIINLGLNISWLILWDRQEVIASAIVITLMAITLYFVNGISMGALDHFGKDLVAGGNSKEIGLVRGTIHNGVGMYATWVTVATLLNFAIVLIYKVDLSVEDGSSVALGILAFLVLVYSSVEIFLLDRYTRYLFTPYIVLILALVGIIGEQWDPEKRNSIFTAIILSIVGVAFILKIIIAIVRSRESPEPALTNGSNVIKRTV